MRDLWQELWTTVFVPTIITAFTALASWVGVQIKKQLEKLSDDRIKRELADICVRGVEQVYDYLHGAEKYAKAVDNLTAMLNDKGIVITDLEIKMLIEAAVQRMNAEIKKTGEKTDDAILQECTACNIVYEDGDEK